MWLNLRTFYSVCKMCVSVHVYRHCSLQGRYRDLLRFYQLNGSSFQCMSMKCSGFFSPVRVKRESLNELPMQILLVCFKDLLLTSLFFFLSLQALHSFTRDCMVGLLQTSWLSGASPNPEEIFLFWSNPFINCNLLSSTKWTVFITSSLINPMKSALTSVCAHSDNSL